MGILTDLLRMHLANNQQAADSSGLLQSLFGSALDPVNITPQVTDPNDPSVAAHTGAFAPGGPWSTGLLPQDQSQVLGPALAKQTPQTALPVMTALQNSTVANLIDPAILARKSIAGGLATAQTPAQFSPVQVSPQTVGAGIQNPNAATNFNYGGMVTPSTISPDTIRNLALQAYSSGGNPSDIASLLNIGKNPLREVSKGASLVDENGNVTYTNTDATPESPLGKLATDFNAGRITKEEYNAGIAKETNISGNGGESPLGKLANDYNAGRITKQEYDAAVAKETRAPPPTDNSYLAPVLDKISKGQPLTDADNRLLAVMKPNASPPDTGNGTAPGTFGSTTIDATAPGYATETIPNTGGLTRSALDQAAILFATERKFPTGMGIGSTGAGGQRKTAIQNRAGELDAGGNLSANGAQLKALTTSLTQQTTYANNTERSVNNAENGYQQVVKAFSGKVNNSQIPIVNAITNAVKYQLSPGDVSAFRAGLTEVANEYTNVFSRGGIVTDAVRSQAQRIADGNLSITDLGKVFAELQAQGDIVINGSKSQAQQIQGQLNNILSGKGSAQSASAGAQPPAGASAATKTINGVTYHLVNGQWMQ